MSKYLSRALRGLGAIYRFPGQRSAPPTIDIDTPMQLVHDVSRGAGINSGVYRTVSIQLLQAGIGNVFATATREFILNSLLPVDLGSTPESWEVWVMGSQVNLISGGGFTDATAAVFIPNVSSPAGVDWLIGHWNSVVEATAPRAAGTKIALLEGAFALPLNQHALLPVRLPPLGEVLGVLNTSGATTVSMSFLCWCAPAGATPPGA